MTTYSELLYAQWGARLEASSAMHGTAVCVFNRKSTPLPVLCNSLTLYLRYLSFWQLLCHSRVCLLPYTAVRYIRASKADAVKFSLVLCEFSVQLPIGNKELCFCHRLTQQCLSYYTYID